MLRGCFRRWVTSGVCILLQTRQQIDKQGLDSYLGLQCHHELLFFCSIQKCTASPTKSFQIESFDRTRKKFGVARVIRRGDEHHPASLKLRPPVRPRFWCCSSVSTISTFSRQLLQMNRRVFHLRTEFLSSLAVRLLIFVLLMAGFEEAVVNIPRGLILLRCNFCNRCYLKAARKVQIKAASNLWSLKKPCHPLF